MARPLRIEYPDAFYHVMNRGAGRQNIFRTLEDYNLFLDLIAIAQQKYEIEIHAYCLMTNHYHLLIRTFYSSLHKVRTKSKRNCK